MTYLGCQMYLLADKICNKVIRLSHGAELEYACVSVLSTNTKDHVCSRIPAKAFLELDFVNWHSHPNSSIPAKLPIFETNGQISVNFIYSRHSGRGNNRCCANMPSCCVNGRHTQSAICNVCCRTTTQFPDQKCAMVVYFFVPLWAIDKL